MTPLVSICLPNLNNRPFLEERIQTILDQTWQDWEMIIVDNHSDDGAWEYFQGLRDPRIRIQQAPKEGMYANWNNCIRLAKGEYVYIATSDDTMTPDCLQKLVQGLEEHPECDIVHSNLTVIDQDGNEKEGFYKSKCASAKYFGERIHEQHVRYAPHDGLLHYYGGTVYVSITQLLIRRSLFERVGFFRNDFGSAADFEWEMRASLVANTLHVPEYLGTWRVHDVQATSFAFVGSRESKLKHLRMTRSAIDAFQSSGGRFTWGSQRRWEWPFIIDPLAKEMAAKHPPGKMLTLLRWMLKRPLPGLYYLWFRLQGKRFDSATYTRKRIERLLAGNPIRNID